MAAESIIQKLQSEATCFICSEYFIDPITLDCGHNFCHACVLKHWGKSLDVTACPRCRNEVARVSFKPNGQLAHVAGLIRQLSEQARQGSGRVKDCEEHQEVQRSFCKDDKALFCSGCDESKEHQAHSVVPVDEVAQEYKDRLVRCIEVLKEEKDKIVVQQLDTEKQYQDHLQLTEKERQNMATAFKELTRFMGEQWDYVVARMEEVDDNIMLKRDKHMARLSKELNCLKAAIEELEAKSQQPVLQFLQDVGSILEKCEKQKFPCTAAFPTEAKLEIWKLCHFNAWLLGTIKQFEDTMESGYQEQEENVTGDSDTDQPKRLKLEVKPQDPRDSIGHSFYQSEMLEPPPRTGQRQGEHVLIFPGDSKDTEQECHCLLGAGNTLKRFVTKGILESSGAFPPAQKWELWQLCDSNAILENVMGQCKDIMNSGHLLKKEKVTLDPDMSHPKLILSKDCKSLTLGDMPQDLINDHKRFDQCLFVLGCEEFASGRHCWDVVVGHEDGWGVEVARKSVRRKGIVSLRPAEGIWAIAKWGDHLAVLSPPHFPSQPMRWVLKRVRVSLNYSGGRLAFFDADGGNLLYAFSGLSFLGEL
ncbi:E3 ubiquitin-protein ligase TRIM7-like [Rhineura floridana]|uniref:E3 ubiquitin-protein ligase TRIM7-like n=1 Tax=Rhineura floridana TaxID=261503 RepID=UPI002AC842C7|nr:E3 ubiquitin-protein ligase TRIM7-like [Rhineura floridana]